jgi:hypothetical protein
MPYQIKKGFLPSLIVQAIDKNGNAIDLSDYDSATFKMKQNGAIAAVIDYNVAEITTPAIDGLLKYTFTSGETDIVGKYKAFFALIKGGVKTLSVPTSGFLEIDIIEDL